MPPGEAQLTIADLGEFGLIAEIAARLPRGERTVVGVGDDAAVVSAPDGRVVATMDILVEGVHFRREWSSAAEIGAKAAAQNLADVAAMGAVPVALLVGFGAPGDLPAAWALDLVSGIVAECARVGATVVGGDTSGAGSVVLAITALGDLAGRSPVTRAGARPGDVVAIAGALGRSAAGLALLEAGQAEPAPLVAAHRRPSPRYQAGPEAARLGATSMIDVSDGLIADAGHLARASRVRIDIATARLPVDPELTAAAAALGHPTAIPAAAPALEWVLAGGEDHAFAATFPPGVSLPPYWTVIGLVHEGEGVQVDGRPFAGLTGWNHFGR